MIKGKRFFLIGLALAGMFLSSVACDSSDTDDVDVIKETSDELAEDTTDAVETDDSDNVPDVGEATLDELAEDTVDAIETGVSALCTACTVVNGKGSDSCTGVCD